MGRRPNGAPIGHDGQGRVQTCFPVPSKPVSPVSLPDPQSCDLHCRSSAAGILVYFSKSSTTASFGQVVASCGLCSGVPAVGDNRGAVDHSRCGCDNPTPLFIPRIFEPNLPVELIPA
jgi:hypothetical protein